MASTAQPKRVNRVAPREPPPKENRDPNNINDHLKVDFYSVLAEPTTSPQSLDCTWECSEIFFTCFFDCSYKLFSLFCGVCMAIYWAFEFVPVIFSSVWIFTPLRQFFYMACGFWCKSVWTLCLRCCVKPCARSCGHLFINCGDGTIDRSESPPLYTRKPRQKPQPKPEVTEQPKEDKNTKIVPIMAAGEFDNYDKDKINNSVKRTMMFY